MSLAPVTCTYPRLQLDFSWHSLDLGTVPLVVNGELGTAHVTLSDLDQVGSFYSLKETKVHALNIYRTI